MKKFVLSTVLIIIMITLTNCDTVEGDLTGKSDYSLEDGFGKTSGSGNGDSTITEIKAGQITAGEWNDLEHWKFIDSLLTADTVGYQKYWSIYINNRISVKVTDASSKPAIDVKIDLKRNGTVIWTARTDNSGRAELWSDLYQHSDNSNTANLSFSIDSQTFSNVLNFSQGINQIKLNSTKSIPNKAEIAFVVDATGSMGDELEYLKVELLDVINSAKTQNPEISLSTGSVFYRDEGDEYITKISDFSSNIQTTLNFIKEQRASGGGDYPEAVHKALDKAINNLQWSSNTRTRLIFLVLDAPPHYETDVISSLQKSLKSASENGIKIIPVTASGVDKPTEFAMRFFDIITNGTYVFITNDSGIGNSHIQATVGYYQVEYLNNLLTRLINKYIQITEP